MRLWEVKMKIYDNRNDEGRLISFEIRNVGRSRVCHFVERTFPSTAVRREHSDNFAVFDLNERTFIVTEPWGDNSRYLIHQEPVQPSTELETLRAAFEKYRSSSLFSGDRSFGIIMAVFALLFACIVVAVALLSHR
jgi:hypothetical protein